MDDYDVRQLQYMCHQLAAFRARTIDLSALISSLESLSQCLRDTPPTWLHEFRQQWAILEQVYSTAVVYEEPTESPSNDALIRPAVEKIAELIDSLLAESR